MAVYIWPPVSVTTLPPLGGATSANQVLEIAELQDINANTAGPIKIRRDGTVQEVNKDTGIPANTVPVPVEIVAASGTEINITAGDINIQTTSEGVNFDSMRIGNGSGFYAEVTSNNDLSTFDSLSFTELIEINQQTLNIDLKTPALIGGKVPVETGLAQGLTDVELRAAPVPVSGSTSETAKTGSFDEILAFSTIQTFVAPANAISANIMNVGGDNVRYKQGAVATGVSGLRLEPGRSEMIMNGSDISVIPETGAGSCDVAIIWNIQP